MVAGMGREDSSSARLFLLNVIPACFSPLRLELEPGASGAGFNYLVTTIPTTLLWYRPDQLRPCTISASAAVWLCLHEPGRGVDARVLSAVHEHLN